MAGAQNDSPVSFPLPLKSDTLYPTLLRHGVLYTTHHTHYTLHSHYFNVRCHRSEASLAVTRRCGSEPRDRQVDLPIFLQCVQVSLPVRGRAGWPPHDHCRDHAWGHDDVTPVNQNFTDDRNGWGATIVDSLSTMVRGCFPFRRLNGS